MNRDRRRAGVGGVLFAVSLLVGFTLFGPKGGHYSASEVEHFVAQGPAAFIVSLYLLVLSIIGLIAVTTYLSDLWVDAGRQRRVTWGASLAAGSSFLIGWGIYLAVPTSVLAGGEAIDPAITYALLSAGMVVFFGVGGMLLGIALITLATGAMAAPTWMRAFTGLAGLAALFSWAFLLATGWSPNQWLPGPFYVVVLWGLVVGIWLLVSAPRPDTPMPTDR
ncbi:MAG: hypothetical protein ABIQ05_06770 [Candidatus Limnocylindria bacterium]